MHDGHAHIYLLTCTSEVMTLWHFTNMLIMIIIIIITYLLLESSSFTFPSLQVVCAVHSAERADGLCSNWLW